MSLRALTWLATLGSLGLLAGAFAFQHLGGLAPCQLCLTQRWPHAAAVLIGAVILMGPFYRFAPLGAFAALTTAAYGLYHVGVEHKWWAGPSTCSGGLDRSDLNAEEILEQLLATPVVRCDEVVWDLLGVSMAGWNAILSLGLAGVWILISSRAFKAVT
ncbi:MAG: disulfide bond formation protein B [Pseudomonadota bacterium]